MKVSFYYVDEKYIEYLKEAEIQQRGYTTVPNVSYTNKSKFVYGIVLSMNDISYYVPVSSYMKQQENNLLILNLRIFLINIESNCRRNTGIV